MMSSFGDIPHLNNHIFYLFRAIIVHYLFPVVPAAPFNNPFNNVNCRFIKIGQPVINIPEKLFRQLHFSKIRNDYYPDLIYLNLFIIIIKKLVLCNGKIFVLIDADPFFVFDEPVHAA
jgi:hypothetical protein